MRRLFLRVLAAVVVLIIVLTALFEYRHQRGNRRAAQLIADFQVQPLGDIGSTDTLTILPLIDYHSADPSLLTEVGVSYLIDTDDHRILFDVGHNMKGENPSPLQRNMQALGIDLASIDTVFISHNHLDHVGGLHWSSMDTFSLGTEQHPFPNPRTRLIVPSLMTYPGLTPTYADKPIQIGNALGTTGLASTGAIPRQLVLGWIEEHSLVINVTGLGGVLIVGCGHQPVPNLLERYAQTFSEPLYGLVGGLHLPVPEGRIQIGPIDGQRRLASGKGLFSPLTMAEAEQHIGMLKQHKLGLIAVGAHDSSDEVIELVRREFGAAHRYVRVGQAIVIGGG